MFGVGLVLSTQILPARKVAVPPLEPKNLNIPLQGPA